ncbi:MAG TPA: hypothetical protein VF081_02860 [Solirubrobacterales bacterium]
MKEDSRPGRENEIPVSMEQTPTSQITNGPLNPIPLIELDRGPRHFANNLVDRQRLRIEGENFIEDPRLVAEILGGGRGAFIVARALRLVVHGRSLSCAMPPAVSAARGRFFWIGRA